MALQYERPLQSALFDTLGRKGDMPVFEATAFSAPTIPLLDTLLHEDYLAGNQFMLVQDWAQKLSPQRSRRRSFG